MPKPNQNSSVKEMKDYIRSKKLNHPLIRLGLKKAELVSGLKKLGHWDEVAKVKKTRAKKPEKKKAEPKKKKAPAKKTKPKSKVYYVGYDRLADEEFDMMAEDGWKSDSSYGDFDVLKRTMKSLKEDTLEVWENARYRSIGKKLVYGNRQDFKT